jgi:hypothetical protein
MKSKRGISPLISWILLIGFAVAMAGFVGTWIINQAKEVEFPGEGPEIYCDSIKLSYTSICRSTDNKTININLKNTGDFKITKFLAGRETNESEEQWCLKQNIGDNNKGLMPDEEMLFNLSIGESMIPNNQMYKNCNEVIIGISNAIVEKITFVPWIEIEGEIMYCSKQKVILRQEDININNPCISNGQEESE